MRIKNMTHEEIINAANEKGFCIEISTHPRARKKISLPAKLAGSKLNFPIAHAGHLQMEISWQLAERIATGQTKTVLA
jgi:hypothetical protein